MGLRFAAPQMDLDRIRAWKNSVVQRLTGGLGQLAKARKITVVTGSASFLSANTVAVGFVQERERVIRQQQEAIRELSTPVLQVRERLPRDPPLQVGG